MFASRTLAPHVKEVTAVDISEHMMGVGKQQAKERNIHNIEWVVSRAQEVSPKIKSEI